MEVLFLYLLYCWIRLFSLSLLLEGLWSQDMDPDNGWLFTKCHGNENNGGLVDVRQALIKFIYVSDKHIFDSTKDCKTSEVMNIPVGKPHGSITSCRILPNAAKLASLVQGRHYYVHIDLQCQDFTGDWVSAAFISSNYIIAP